MESGGGTVSRGLPSWGLFAAAAAVFWGVGALPWVLEGMRLPLSSAWSDFGTDTPLTALPFSEYSVTRLLTMGVVGGVAAVAVSRVASSSTTAPRTVAALGGLVGLLTATTQTWFAISPGLRPAVEAALLVGLLVVDIVGSGLLGLAAGLALTGPRPWPRLLAGALAAALLPAWLNDLVHTDPVAAPGWVTHVWAASPWLGGALLGLVLGTFGLRPAARVVGWLLALAIAWVLPPAVTAVDYAAAYVRRGGISREHLLEVADAGRDLFVAALSPGQHVVGPFLLAVGIGLVLAVRAHMANTTGPAPSPR